MVLKLRFSLTPMTLKWPLVDRQCHPGVSSSKEFYRNFLTFPLKDCFTPEINDIKSICRRQKCNKRGWMALSDLHTV